MDGAALSSCYKRMVIAPPMPGRLVTWVWKTTFMSSIISGLIVEYWGTAVLFIDCTAEPQRTISVGWRTMPSRTTPWASAKSPHHSPPSIQCSPGPHSQPRRSLHFTTLPSPELPKTSQLTKERPWCGHHQSQARLYQQQTRATLMHQPYPQFQTLQLNHLHARRLPFRSLADRPSNGHLMKLELRTLNKMNLVDRLQPGVRMTLLLARLPLG